MVPVLLWGQFASVSGLHEPLLRGVCTDEVMSNVTARDSHLVNPPWEVHRGSKRVSPELVVGPLQDRQIMASPGPS